jgi:hypothetical protein
MAVVAPFSRHGGPRPCVGSKKGVTLKAFGTFEKIHRQDSFSDLSEENIFERVPPLSEAYKRAYASRRAAEHGRAPVQWHPRGRALPRRMPPSPFSGSRTRSSTKHRASPASGSECLERGRGTPIRAMAALTRAKPERWQNDICAEGLEASAGLSWTMRAGIRGRWHLGRGAQEQPRNRHVSWPCQHIGGLVDDREARQPSQ